MKINKKKNSVKNNGLESKIGSQDATAILQPARKGRESDFDKWIWGKKKKKVDMKRIKKGFFANCMFMWTGG